MNKLFFIAKPILFLAILFSYLLVFTQSDEEIRTALQHKIEAGIEQGDIRVGDIYLFNSDSLTKYYVKRQFELVWGDKKNRNDFIEVIKGAYDHGLIPSDYHTEAIIERFELYKSGNRDPELIAEIDLLITDAISLYTNHMNYGKVMQSKLRKDWEVPENPMPDDPVKSIEIALQNNTLLEYVKEFGPQHFMYKHLKNGLKHYREIAENDGWPTIPEGETLKKEMNNERIAIMRERLLITGDLTNKSPADTELFDEELETAVKMFQLRHNLTQDGAVGKNTLAQMNIPVEDRINKIRINMERARWIMHELEEDFLVVNIAGFNIRRVTKDEIVYFSPVIVGRPYHQSPVFKATVQYFVINPTWTVPYSIATKETLPKLQKDPGYLDKHNMIIMDRSGKKLNPASIDFSQYSRSNFPFTVRQEPGPHNALGEVKFIFPNPHSVYVHDTPGRSLFTREERAFSHGCIRLQKKWELLMSLMDDPEVWNMDKINEVLASGKTTTVHLTTPIDILILYWTAGADKKDHIYFNEDIYKRDAAVLEALDTPWKFKSAD